MASQQSTQSAPKSQKNLVLRAVGFLLLCLVLFTGALAFFTEGAFLSSEFSGIPADHLKDPPPLFDSADPSPAAPDPAAPTDPIVAPAPHEPGSDAFGLSLGDTLPQLSAAELERVLEDIVSLRVGWIRIDFDWGSIQREGKDTFNWGRIDRVVAAASKHQLKVLAILTYAPAWARSTECGSKRCPPVFPFQFAEFAATAVKRYAPLGVNHWEIWNEPNHAFFWEPAANVAGYTKLLAAAYTAIKEADPSSVVLAGGLAPKVTGEGSIAHLEFLQGLYAEGGKPYFDAVAFHPYSFPVTASHQAHWSAWQQMSNASPSLRSIMEEHGDAEKKIWLTEYGAPTGGPGAASAGYHPGERADHVTEALQAKTLTDAAEAIEEYAWAGPLFWYTYKDLGTSNDTVENFFGILRFDGSHKPAYEALLQAALNAL